MIEFFAHGIPKGQPRPRAFARNGVARVYDPGTAENWKSQIAEAARPHLPAAPMDGPITVEIVLYFPRPKAHFVKKGLRVDAPIWHTSKPDSDNAAKAIMDALTTLGAWRDDAQIGFLIVRKLYGDDKTGADIRFWNSK